MRTPPPPRGHRGRVGRQWNEGAGRTTRPCPKGARVCQPQRGDHQGCDLRKGRVTTGATRQAPPPPAEGQVPRLVPAPCLRRAYAIGRTARTPPTQEKAEDSKETARGHGGGQRTDRNAGGRDERRAKKKQRKNKQQRTPTRQSRGRQQGQTGHGGSQEARQGARDGGTPWGRKLGGRDQHRNERGGGGGVTRARKRRW